MNTHRSRCTGSTCQRRSRDLLTRRRLPVPTLLIRVSLSLLAAIWFAGCTPHVAIDDDPLAAGRIPLAEFAAPDSLAATAAGAVVDTLPVVANPTLPVGPDGLAPLESLESLYREALQLAAEESYRLSEDLLFVLQEQVLAPTPADADTLYLAHRKSLERRLYLLGALLVEATAFVDQPALADSALAAGYEGLTRFAMPDSLVPATGTTLPPLTADLLKVHNSAVEKWITYFTGRGHRHFKYWLERKASVEPLVAGILAEYDLSRQLICLAMIESGLSSRARSHVGAVGPWQFMPGTAKMFGLRNDWWVDERRDLELSTRAAAQYLVRLYEQFGDWALVLAAYNAGENRIARQIRLTGHTDFWRLRLPRQTTDYVPKFIAATRIAAAPERYGFAPVTPPSFAYDIVPVDDATDLGQIARCAGVSEQEIVALNPALLRGASPPSSPGYPVRVPEGTGHRARTAWKKIPPGERLTWRRHKVERGETMSEIALRYGTSIRDVARLNNLESVHLIHPGDHLLIPMPAQLAERARSRAAEKGHYVPPDGYQRVSYQVIKGDTLGGIAGKLGVTLRHLRKVNGIYRSSLIHPGQRLYAYRPGK